MNCKYYDACAAFSDALDGLWGEYDTQTAINSEAINQLGTLYVQYEKLRRENKQLREIVSRITAALTLSEIDDS